MSIFSGYIAPEYASRGLYSLKIDVFSFGVLALVIISGRKNAILQQQGDTVGNLVQDVSEQQNGVHFKHCLLATDLALKYVMLIIGAYSCIKICETN